ncbi:sensor histidine kinase [Algoriphagus sp. PAP.12]|uniref:sensor histidine kinase n=1 Tax=Algoriphagus sp. PAP.12 TaxID=2996678 RepID=UPI00227A6360|nr:ATP-binding protein [Algoriphagus sp. PAP.12]
MDENQFNDKIITYPDNEDIVFSLKDDSIIKFSVRLKEVFPEFPWDTITSLSDFEKVAKLPEQFGARVLSYPKFVNIKASYILNNKSVNLLVKELGWYNVNTNTIHILIYPGQIESNFTASFKEVVSYMERLQKPAVLFDYNLENVFSTNYELIEILCDPLSTLGNGFQVGDFFLDQNVFEDILIWKLSESISLTKDLLLRLKIPTGNWFEVTFSKLKVEGSNYILAVLKDVDSLIKVHQNQLKKNLILSRLTEVQNLFLAKTQDFDPYKLFLDAILDVSYANYGFVGEVRKGLDGKTFMKIHAVTDFGDQGRASKELLKKLEDDNFLFRHFDNLFGACIKTGQVIKENNPPSNPYSSNKVVNGHPKITNFLGIPILNGKEVVGLIGLGNKMGGFTDSDVEDLKPFATTYSVILNALDNEERNQELQKESSEKALILSTVGDHSPDTIVVLDRDFQFKFLSPSYIKHFGRGIEEKEAKRKIRSIINRTISPNYLQANQTYRSRLRITNLEGEHRWLETSINIFEEEDKKKIIAFIREVTLQVKSEHSLKASLKKERQFKMFLSEFMGIVAHEFKTPLATILSSLEISDYYLGQVQGEGFEKLKHHLEKIKIESDTLHRIAVNSLEYERFVEEEVVLKRELFSLNDFVEKVISQYGLTDQVLFVSKMPKEFQVNWDSFLMQTTIVNLIKNAIKFSKGKDRPIISIHSDKNGFSIHVQDYGIGISSKDLPYIFTPFYRGGNANDIEGTGLGLIAVKNFVKLHGGEVEIKSKVNEGTLAIMTFYNE